MMMAECQPHVLDLLENRIEGDDDSELLRIMAYLHQEEIQYSEMQRESSNEQEESEWSEEIAPARNCQISNPPGRVSPYKNCRLNIEELRNLCFQRKEAQSEKQSGAEQTVGIERKAVHIEKTPGPAQLAGLNEQALSKPALRDRKKAPFQRKPVQIPTLPSSSESAAYITFSDDDMDDVEPDGNRHDHAARSNESDDATGSVISPGDARAHARGSRLLMHALSAQNRKSSSENKVSRQLQRPAAAPRERATLSTSGAAHLLKSRGSETPPKSMNLSGDEVPEVRGGSPNTVPTLPLLPRKGPILDQGPASPVTSGCGSAEKRRRLGLPSAADVIRPGVLNFPRRSKLDRTSGRKLQLVPLVTKSVIPKSSPSLRNSLQRLLDDDDDDADELDVTPPSPAVVTPTSKSNYRPTPSISTATSSNSQKRSTQSSLRTNADAGSRRQLSATGEAARAPAGVRGLSLESSSEGAAHAAAGGWRLSSASSSSEGAADAAAERTNGTVTDDATGNIQCPICSRRFPRNTIEAHASECEGDVLEIRDSPSPSPPPPAAPRSAVVGARVGTPPGFQRCRLCDRLQTEGQEYLAHVDDCLHAHRQPRPGSDESPSAAAAGRRAGLSSLSPFQRISAQHGSCIDYGGQFAPARRRVPPPAGRARRRRGRAARGRTGRL